MNLWRLIKLHLNVSFHLSALRWYLRKDKKKLLGGLALALLVVVSLAPIYFFLYIKLLRAIYETGAMFGQPQAVLTLVLVFTSLIVLFFGVAFVMSVFFFSRDLPLLIPLPVLPRDILGAKFATVLVHEYLTVLPFMLPAVIIFGMGERAGILYWLISILVLLFIPVIPLTLSSAAILLIMRLTNLGRRKDTLRFLGMAFLMVFILVVNYFLARIPLGSEQEMVQRLFSESEGLVMLISRSFPPALWATRAMAAAGTTRLLNLLAYIATALAGIALTLFLGDRLFYRGLIGGEEVTAAKNISAEKLEKTVARSSCPEMAIALREIKMLFRTPIYLFNSVAMLLILPIVLIIPSLSGQGLSQILAFIQTEGARQYSVLAGAGFMGSMALFTPAASSSFSREGKLFWISQIIPVEPIRQVNGKILYSFLISFLAIPLMILASVTMVHWTAVELLLVILLGTIISLPAITISLLADLARPYLTWDNPQKAIKQNLNVVLGMAFGGLLFYGLYRFTMYLMNKDITGMPLYAAVGILALVFGLLPYLVIIKIAPNRYRNITL